MAKWFKLYSVLIIYKVFLDVSYVFVISNVFAYEGYVLFFSYSNYFLSWVIYFLAIIFTNKNINSVSDYFFITAVVSVLAPISTLYGLDSTRNIVPVLLTFFSFSVIFAIVKLSFLRLKKPQVVKGGMTLGISISLVFVAFLVVWYLASGVSLNFDFSKVYEFRDENFEKSAPGILAYTNGWTYQIFNMLLFSICLHYRRFSLAIIVFVIQIFFFAASTHKSVLFFPFLILGVWFYYRKHSSSLIVPLLHIFILVLSFSTYFFLNDVWVSSLFVRRVLFVPANLTFVYYDFFINNDFVFWSNSVLSSFSVYPYDKPLPHVIGLHMGEVGLAANNGFVSSGFGHAGYLGVFFYSVIIGFLLKFIDLSIKNVLPVWLAISLCIIPLRNLMLSSDLFTVMLTHGFFVAIFLVFLIRSKKLL